MKFRPTSRLNAGFIDRDMLPILVLPAIMIALTATPDGERDGGERKSCQTLAETVKDLSTTRGDRFVIDAVKLHAFSKTEQPMSFWFKRIIGESNLVEAEDYVVIDNDGRKRPILTIDAVRGIAAKSIEGGEFLQSPEARTARRMLECLQEPYFPKSSGAAE